LLGFPRAARLFVLKGLVVPRWRRRAIALLGARLLLFPGKKNSPKMPTTHPENHEFLFIRMANWLLRVKVTISSFSQ
jgi:hypothetical protein